MYTSKGTDQGPSHAELRAGAEGSRMEKIEGGVSVRSGRQQGHQDGSGFLRGQLSWVLSLLKKGVRERTSLQGGVQGVLVYWGRAEPWGQAQGPSGHRTQSCLAGWRASEPLLGSLWE